MKVLVDNVAAQVIEASLLATLSDILSPTSILKMDSALVTAIAGEPEESQAERDQLMRKLGVLKSGLEICKRYGNRPVHFGANVNKPNGASASSPVAASADGFHRERSFSPGLNGTSGQGAPPLAEHERSQPRSPISDNADTGSLASPHVEQVEEGIPEPKTVPQSAYEDVAEPVKSFGAPTPRTEPRPLPVASDSSGWGGWGPISDSPARTSKKGKKRTPKPWYPETEESKEVVMEVS